MRIVLQLSPLFLLVIAIFFPSLALPDTAVEEKFVTAGLVTISAVDRTIRVDLVNSDPEKNFFRENFYDGLKYAYLREPVAVKLSKAQEILKQKQPNYSLQVLDAARPRSVSRAMYEKMKGTTFENYVANPDKGSMHNYGIAVDITIVDETGKGIDMGPSPFYKNTLEIYWQYAKMKLGFNLNSGQISNRKLLSDVMSAAGFYPLNHEWWHYNGMKKDAARKAFKIIE